MGGLEMVLSMMGVKPEDVKEGFTKVKELAISVDARIARLEEDSKAIREHLGIPREDLKNGDTTDGQ